MKYIMQLDAHGDMSDAFGPRVFHDDRAELIRTQAIQALTEYQQITGHSPIIMSLAPTTGPEPRFILPTEDTHDAITTLVNALSELGVNPIISPEGNGRVSQHPTPVTVVITPMMPDSYSTGVTKVAYVYLGKDLARVLGDSAMAVFCGVTAEAVSYKQALTFMHHRADESLTTASREKES